MFFNLLQKTFLQEVTQEAPEYYIKLHLTSDSKVFFFQIQTNKKIGTQQGTSSGGLRSLMGTITMGDGTK